MAFVRRHHPLHTCSPVYQYAYALCNARDHIAGVAVFGPAHSPALARGFTAPPYQPHMIYNQRLIAKGVRPADLDALLAYARCDLEERGFWWIYTLTKPTAHTVDGWRRFTHDAFSGAVYARNGYLYCGQTTPSRHIESVLVDGVPYGVRQGKTTLTRGNVHAHFPHARTIQIIEAGAKMRWTAVLGSPAEVEQRILLMRHRPQPLEERLVQPRLLQRRKERRPLPAFAHLTMQPR